jgi:hypothetical protein
MTPGYGRHCGDDTADLHTEPADGLDLDDLDLDDLDRQDDLATEVQRLHSRRLTGRTTAVLGGLLLIVGGFVAGAQVQKHWGAATAQAANPFANLGGARPGASGFPAFGGGGQGQPNAQASAGAGSGAATTGTVKLVDGDTVYIQTADGTTVTVRTTAATSVQVASPASVKDLPVGATVSVDGRTAGDGTVAASRITRTK